MERKHRIKQALTSTRNLSLVLTLGLIDSVRINMFNPLLPLFIRDLGATMFEVGVILSISSFASTLLPVIGGFISDRYGRKTVLVVSVLLSIFPPIFYTLASSWKQIIPWILLNAVSTSLLWPARTAFIADSVGQRKRATIYGVMNLALPVGSVFGPFLGGSLAESYGWNTMFYSVALMSVFSILPVHLLSESGSNMRKSRGSLLNFQDHRRFVYPITIFTFLSIFLHLGWSVVNPIIPVYLSDKFQLSIMEVGLFFTISQGISGVIGNLSGGVIADKYSRKGLLLMCALIIPLMMVFWPLMTQYVELLVIWMVFWGLRSMMLPSRTAFLMEVIPASTRGLVSGITMIGGRVGVGLGTIIGGFLYETLGLTATFYWSALLWGLCIPTIMLLKEKDSI